MSPPPLSKSVGWIVDAGTDFPPELHSIIASWDTGVLFRSRKAPTTRGWNGYGENEHRAFKYLTEKKRLTADDLTPDLLRLKSVHLICHAYRCTDMIEGLHERRRESFGDTEPPPLVIWEPVPDLCVPSELDNTKNALKCVDVISPNHEELAALFGHHHEGGVQRNIVEQQASELLTHGIGAKGEGAVVVRCGKEGCYVATSRVRRWLPAYHHDASKVIDPTGGGNGFLGGFAVGLVRTDFDVVEAAGFGSVAASFCIEQVGMPVLTPELNGAERWNGESVVDRLAEYRNRTAP